jgi:endonuclease-3 related protein
MKKRTRGDEHATVVSVPAGTKKTGNGRFMTAYELLRRAYGPQRWWPVTPPGETKPRYTGGPHTELQKFEVAAGAILTQNTAWSNASRAIESLNENRFMNPEALLGLDEKSLARLIRSAGYYHQKAKRLKILAAFFLTREIVTRRSLLALNGVGPETADSIMLYAFGEPHFVVDAYTRRIFGRLGLAHPDAPYEEVRRIFERNLPRRIHVYREYHALIVEHGKRVCNKVPLCEICLLKNLCNLYLVRSKERAAKIRS